MTTLYSKMDQTRAKYKEQRQVDDEKSLVLRLIKPKTLLA